MEHHNCDVSLYHVLTVWTLHLEKKLIYIIIHDIADLNRKLAFICFCEIDIIDIYILFIHLLNKLYK